ncbi:energy transducer TonB [bacterium]|nr:energy transducer TonB [bacterium]
MNETWRDDLRRLKGRRFAYWAAVASILFHLLALAVFWLLPAPERSADGDAPVWIDLSQVDAPLPPSAGKVVTAPLPANQRPPEDARYLAERSHRADTQTHRADVPINEFQGEVGTRGQSPKPGRKAGAPKPSRRYEIPEVGEGMRPKTEGAGEGAAGQGEKATQKSLDDLIDSVGYQASRDGASGAAGGGNVSPYNPDSGVPGNAISLNTREFKYFGYFSGLKEKIEWAWVYPQDAMYRGQQGQLTLAFTILRSGRLKEIKLVRTSGFPLLDQGARRAVEDAADFSPFPESWPDEELTIVGTFAYRLYGAKSVF